MLPDDTDEREVRAALATLVATEPELPEGADDIERRGRRRRNRAWFGSGGALAVLAIAATVVVASWPGAPTAPPVAIDPPTATFDPAGGTMLAGFTIDAAVTAVTATLPAGTTVGELPADIGFQEGGILVLPLAPTGSLTLTIAGGSCSAQAAALSTSDLTRIATSVCAAWEAAGSPVIIPATPSDEEHPELAAQ